MSGAIVHRAFARRDEWSLQHVLDDPSILILTQKSSGASLAVWRLREDAPFPHNRDRRAKERLTWAADPDSKRTE